MREKTETLSTSSPRLFAGTATAPRSRCVCSSSPVFSLRWALQTTSVRNSGSPHLLLSLLRCQRQKQQVAHVLWLPGLPGLSLEQVDILWHCLVEDAECYDDALHWFLNQVRSKDQHAMGMETYKHLFLEKVGIKQKTWDKTLSRFFCLVFRRWHFVNKMGLASLIFDSFVNHVDAPAEAWDHQHDGPQPLPAPLQLGSTGHQCAGQQCLQLWGEDRHKREGRQLLPVVVIADVSPVTAHVCLYMFSCVGWTSYGALHSGLSQLISAVLLSSTSTPTTSTVSSHFTNSTKTDYWSYKSPYLDQSQGIRKFLWHHTVLYIMSIINILTNRLPKAPAVCFR